MNTRASRFLSVLSILSLFTALVADFPAAYLRAETNPVPAQSSGSMPPDSSTSDLSLAVGKSAIVNSRHPIERVSVGLGEVAEVTAISPQEVLVNGKTPGSTTMIIWEQGGGKQLFDVNVQPSSFVKDSRLGNVRRELAKELPGQDIAVTSENDAIFLRGTAKDLVSVQRAVLIASTGGKVVNLMYVNVPPPQAQILLKVRFASIDRTNGLDLAFHLFSTGAGNTIGTIGTQQFPQANLPAAGSSNTGFTFSDLLNIFLYNKNINLGTTIKALEAKGVLQMLAEPNLLAENGKQASFLAGGEVPYPVFQGSSGGTGAVTIQFKEFGVRLSFIPNITPDGSIHLQVAPEVSSLDYADGVTIQGFNVPALNVRRMKTDIELQDGQSFAISGLLDRQVTQTLEKIPFIGDIPVLGKLFQSKSLHKQNSELLVIVTPEIVRPMPTGAPPVNLHYPVPFLDEKPGVTEKPPGEPLPATIPPVPATLTIPIETLLETLRPEKPLEASGSSQSGTSNGTQQQDTAAPASAAPAPPTASPQP